ncbi:MAG: hypothetical protein OEV92_07285, partial [Nitrospinota bacterium]|nr:hypothetical protein [Nitrospinota bacterium]
LRRMERQWPGLIRLGPVDAVVFRVKNRYRWKIMFKAKSPALLYKALRAFISDTAQAAGGAAGRVRLIVDMDALDVM